MSHGPRRARTKKPARHAQPYTPQELALLRSSAGRLTHPEIAELLGRTRSAVAQRLLSMGLTFGLSKRGRASMGPKQKTPVWVEGVGRFPSCTAAAEELGVVRSTVSSSLSRGTRVQGRRLSLTGEFPAEPRQHARSGTWCADRGGGEVVRRGSQKALAALLGVTPQTVSMQVRAGKKAGGCRVWVEPLRFEAPGG